MSEQLLINSDEDCLPFVYILIIAELQSLGNSLLHSVIMIISERTVNNINQHPNRSRFLYKYTHANRAFYLYYLRAQHIQ